MSTAVAERAEPQTSVAPANVEQHPASDSTALIQMIERVALNPAADITKMERLLEMQERILARNARSAYDTAFAEMQPALPIVSERGKITGSGDVVRSTYALWEDINEAIKPVLKDHGFSLRFRSEQPNGQVIVTGILSHVGGHSEDTSITLPADPSGGKNGVQAIGSSISYGKRYTAGELLNLTSRGEDDDGTKAGGAETISQSQVDALNDLIDVVIEEVGGKAPTVFRPNMLKHLKVASLDQLPAAYYQKAVDAINSARPKK